MRTSSNEAHHKWPVWIRYFFLIGLFAFITRIVLDSGFRHSGILYLLIPYLVAVSVYFFIPSPSKATRWGRFGRGVFGTLLVMMGTSVLLFEGFLCILMFLPIYLIVVLLTFLVMVAFPPKEDKSAVFKSSILPLVIGLASLEGVWQTTSANREYTIKKSIETNLTINQIHENLKRPIHLDAKRSRFLSLFPLPTRIEAGTLETGDIHKAYFTYKRWGIDGFNVKDGETWVKIAEVTPNQIKTEIVKDTSYFSHYLTVHGTEINFKKISANQTRVELVVHYRRDLDPFWYFGPMQKAAMNESAEYLLKHVITKEANHATH